MLKIHQLFLRTFILIFLSVLFLLSGATYYWSKSIYIEQIEKNLSQNIDSLAVSLSSIDRIDQIVKALKEKTKLRITIIDQNGVVVAESDKDKNKLDNHSNRYEIIHAKYEGYGKIIRFSNTVNKELVYVAKKVTISKQTYFIRMADYLDQVNENFFKLSLQIIPIFALFLVFAFTATYFIAKRIQKETDNILSFLIKLTKRESVTYIKSSFTMEFDKIARLLKKVAISLSKKDKQKAKQTAKLKLANRQKDEIISAISHEFKNPIAVISGYTETILNDEDMPSSMKMKFLNKIHSNSLKMSTIIDRLRLALKLDEGNEQATFKKCSLFKMLQEIKSDLLVNYKGRELIITGDESVELEVDETLFSIALSNLVENALKYSEDEVVVNIKKDRIEIIDQGIGIEQKELEKITRKFYRVSNNGWNNSLGLGLNIVLNILLLHKFELKISSTPYEGSKFSIKY